jgi:hypothetical protein
MKYYKIYIIFVSQYNGNFSIPLFEFLHSFHF